MENKRAMTGLRKATTRAATLLALAAGLALADTSGVAQGVDSLLDKLVDKGVLSLKEADELRKEGDKKPAGDKKK